MKSTKKKDKTNSEEETNKIYKDIKNRWSNNNSLNNDNDK